MPQFSSFHNFNLREQTITERQKRQLQHEIANLGKQSTKSTLDKGLDYASAVLAENYIIVTIHGYMTQFEKFTMQNDDEKVELFRKLRLEANDQIFNKNKDEFAEVVDRYLGAKVVGYLQDVDVVDEFACWVLFLDAKVKVIP